MALVALLVPFAVDALTLTEARETAALFLYGMIGFFGALAFGLFGAGALAYFINIGTERRVYGIHYMIIGVKVLFGVVCLIVILKIVG